MCFLCISLSIMCHKVNPILCSCSNNNADDDDGRVIETRYYCIPLRDLFSFILNGPNVSRILRYDFLIRTETVIFSFGPKKTAFMRLADFLLGLTLTLVHVQRLPDTRPIPLFSVGKNVGIVVAKELLRLKRDGATDRVGRVLRKESQLGRSRHFFLLFFAEILLFPPLRKKVQLFCARQRTTGRKSEASNEATAVRRSIAVSCPVLPCPGKKTLFHGKKEKFSGKKGGAKIRGRTEWSEVAATQNDDLRGHFCISLC